ncbi:MAG: WYL domain-containing protein [Chloroflexi bacterium]|nr:WYL domain-containing protein [Chloroflexota bacterium]MCI0580140.1 WYL domain-containing protein [Chloroflexota bacterium]MCI0649284.1 WYL domain-containing protein [Chloroflexota bacterium]MCI0725983.1 WYL domain-containing protein [Chloroflexota bacterium]
MLELLERPLTDVPLVVLDTETTGLHPGLGHRIVEIAAIRLEPDPAGKWQITGQFDQLVLPGRRMDPAATQVNGIRDADLVGAPPFSAVADQVVALLEGALLVAHNASFDAGFLGMELYIRSLAAEPGQYATTLPNPWLCTLRLARQLFHFGHNNLGHVARLLGVRAGRAHRALNDVHTTAEIFKRMVHPLAERRLESVGDILHAQGGAIYTPPPPLAHLPSPLAEAITGRQSLRIIYRGPGGATERTITPLYPATYQRVAYLVAYCHLRQDQRTFRLDRISILDANPKHSSGF